MRIMPHEMTTESKIKAADALSRWFETQEMSIPQAVSVSLAFVAAAFIEGVNHGANGYEMRNGIIGIFDSFVLLLRK
jgi:hypothetical protein